MLAIMFKYFSTDALSLYFDCIAVKKYFCLSKCQSYLVTFTLVKSECVSLTINLP